MMADSDANQWRRQFGLDVDHAEQWTLIHAAEKIPDPQTRPLIEQWKSEFKSIDVSDDVLLRSARLYLAGKEMCVRNRWDFAGIKCQFELLDNYLAPCLPIALWNDEGFVVACETDMNAALTMYALHQFSDHPVMFSDIQYLNREERWARFLNCGTAATRLAGDCYTLGLIEYLVREAGAAKVLFGSDCTWIDPRTQLGMVLDADVTLDDKRKIMCDNARRPFRF